MASTGALSVRRRTSTSTAVNIRPGVGILGLFPAMNYKAWYALGELVDNALDSYLLHREALRRTDGSDRLRVVIDVSGLDGGFIRVWDNAAGINDHDYQRAFVTAEPPEDTAGLSQFGIGMKSASCWFAREWRVRSKALAEDIERTVEFDVPRIIQQNIETLEATTAPARPEEHFTEIRLWSLHKPPATQTIGKMRRHLASMYRHFIRDGDLVLEFNGEELDYQEPRVLVAPFYKDEKGQPKTWTKNISFDLSSGEHVEGFAGIRERGSTREAGFSLYRSRRLIVGSDDEPFRPTEIFGGTNSYRYQRLTGEFHLDDFEVSHTKDGFLWEDKESELLQLLRQHLDAPPLPLLAQAEGYRSRKASPNVLKAAQKAVASTVLALPEAQPVIEEQASDSPDEANPPTNYGVTKLASTRLLQLTIKGEIWEITIDTTDDPARTEWLTIRDSKTSGRGVRRLGILMSVSHPFMQRFGGATADDVEGLVRLGVGLAIAEITARESGVQMAGVLRRNLNELLGGVLARQ
jgi:hypothetical protein